MLEHIRAQLRALLDNRSALQADLDAILEGVAARGADADLTEDEQTAFVAARDAIRDTDEQRLALEAREAELVAAEAARDAAAAAEARYGVTAGGNPGPVVTVGAEERTYSQATAHRDGRSFFGDVVSAQVRGDYAAAQRLSAHIAEARVEGELVESRAVGTGAFAGLTVPQYLLDMVAPLRRAARPFADICNAHALPSDGMTVEISRITTGTSAAVQATEGGGVSETNIDDTQLTVPVRTIAGQQTVSFQALQRSRGADEIIIQDLAGAYHTALDSQILNGDGNTGAHLGVRNVANNGAVTYTDSTPTASELWPKLFELIAAIGAGYIAATHLVMHSRRFWWVASNTGPNFPFMAVQGAPGNASGSLSTYGYGEGPSGFIAGLPVIVDNNLPTNLGAGTNEDPVLAVSAPECHLWEDPAPMQVQVEKPATLQVELALYGFSAFTAGRYPLATGDITGTGLVTPSF